MSTTTTITVNIPKLRGGIQPGFSYPNPTPQTTATVLVNPNSSNHNPTNQSSSLPFTGGDVAGLSLIGGAAIVIGVVMARRKRSRAT